MHFTSTHEWINIENQIGTFGFTLKAQKELGDIVYLEFPKIGENVQIGEKVIILESTKAAIDVYTPVSGQIIAINDSLNAKPELFNQDPEGEGWLFKIKLFNLEELKNLMNLEEYCQYISL